MVDSCFKVFKVNCFGKASSIADSSESVLEANDKTAIKLRDNKQINFTTNATSFDNDRKVKADKNNVSADTEYQNLLEMEPEVVLRRHNRQYLRSISTTSYEAITSEEDDDETLDILSPLPRDSVHEWSFSEEAHQQIGMKDSIQFLVKSNTQKLS